MTATTTHYEILAREISHDLEAVAEKLKRLEREAPQLSENFIRAYVNVPIPFLATSVAIVRQEPELGALGKVDADAGQDTLQFLSAFRPVEDQIATVGRILRGILMRRKARLAANALQLYALVRGLARNDVRMASYARDLGRDLGPRGARKKRRDETAETFTGAT